MISFPLAECFNTLDERILTHFPFPKSEGVTFHRKAQVLQETACQRYRRVWIKNQSYTMIEIQWIYRESRSCNQTVFGTAPFQTTGRIMLPQFTELENQQHSPYGNVRTSHLITWWYGVEPGNCCWTTQTHILSHWLHHFHKTWCGQWCWAWLGSHFQITYPIDVTWSQKNREFFK